MTTNPVRRRCVLAAAGVEAIELTVHCPHRRLSLSPDRCATCEHLDAFTRSPGDRTSVVQCSPPESRGSLHRDDHMDTQEAATRTRVADVMRGNVVCVREDTQLESIRALLLEPHTASHTVRSVPVVDAEARPIGMVSRSDLLRDGDLDRVASDVMSPLVHALPEEAPLAFAVALMASEGHVEVPVVDDQRKVVGIIAAVDVMRWLALRFGYRFDSGPVR
jgi:CBS domain-containing protein